ncbi:MAG: metalloregulator ArsR/SmtB family transcription factor [Spirochaetia bacterium]|jgi:ArsR family transcriptional regulator
MDTKQKRIFENRARVIKALAHPTRICIVDRLSQGEQCVRDLTALVRCDMSTVSKHLSILKNAGIVRDEKRGACVYYTLRIPCILNFFQCSDAVIDATVREYATLE